MFDALHPSEWLPEGKRAAVIWTIDDIHPGKSTDAYDGGGDLGEGALGNVQWLLERHEELAVTLFTTADWREISPAPAGWRKYAIKAPVLKDRVFASPIWPKGKMALDRHPGFVDYLKSLPRTEIGLHGLHHCHPGKLLHVEFQEQGLRVCRQTLADALAIFQAAGLPKPAGMCPPGWNLPEPLAKAAEAVGLNYIASARDILSPIVRGAKTNMSGRKGMNLLDPDVLVDADLIHLPANFQATSTPDQAYEIIENGTILSLKAHIIKDACGHVALDGLDILYRNYLSTVVELVQNRFGDTLWFATAREVADAYRTALNRRREAA